MDGVPFLSDIFKSIGIAIVAFLYSAVGHGGATGYIAVMSLFGVKHEAIASSTLIVNCVVAGMALFAYTRAGKYSHKVVLPYLVLSVPCAFAGALVPVDKHLFNMILSVVLPLVGLRFLLWPDLKGESDDHIKRPPLYVAAGIGGVLGLISGMIGIGGGVFLSPIMIAARFATTKETAAASALFILANSLSGIAGRVFEGKMVVHGPDFYPFLSAAIIGALLGSNLGAWRFSSSILKRLLGVVLVIAALKLINST